MKKVLLIAFMNIITLSIYSQIMETYSIGDKSYSVIIPTKANYFIHIQVEAEVGGGVKEASIMIKSDSLKEFNKFLLQMKNKYVEWINVAKANNVKIMSKEMKFKSPLIMSHFTNESTNAMSLEFQLQPKFIIGDEMYLLCLEKEITFYKYDENNELYDDKDGEIYLIFHNPKEIDELISILNIDKIKSKFQQFN